MNATRLVILLTGLVIAGEALALLVGMHFLSEHNNPWISLKNDLLLALDIVTGTALVVLLLRNENLGSLMFGIVLGLSLLAHIYRDWEYLAYAANQFCFNPPLFVVNNVKFAGLLSIVLLVTVQP